MKKSILTIVFVTLFTLPIFSQLIVDHTCTDITQIPQSAIEEAKTELHIAYGHTSHGSQVTDGMLGLVGFANAGGRGLSLPDSIFAWNNGGIDGALDLHDKAMGGDVGYWPAWYDNTVAYLDNPVHSDVNVIMWSWCGQVGDKYNNGHLWDEFLGPMTQLEIDYPEVTFVYMTGHLDYWDRENTNAANDSIRSYCQNNAKVLFDFADIESYGPDGANYKENGDDGCNYYDSGGNLTGNWAQEYQNSHTQGVDWYSCGSAHSQPFNANLKAYAAWHMFASLAGWNYIPPVGIETENNKYDVNLYPNPVHSEATLEISGNTGSDIRFDVVNMNGAVLINTTIPEISGDKLVYKIDMRLLNPGLYYLRIITSEITNSYKLIVIR